MRLLTNLIVLLALLLTAGAAQAATQRYAAPTPGGSGNACTQVEPCELKEAVGKAGAGDEVIVGAGSYSLETELPVPANVYVHGDFSQPLPKISATLAGAAVRTPFMGGHLEYLEVVNAAGSATGIGCYAGTLVERVRISVAGIASIGIQLQGDCLVRDSVLLASGMGSAGVLGTEIGGAGAGSVRNLTAIATGSNSVGVRATGGFIINSSYKIDARNIIASGEEADIAAVDSFNGAGEVVVSNSNFDVATATSSSKVVNGGGNQTAPPIFVNAAAGDYREAGGSPTINAGSGSATELGALDLDGNPRNLGGAPDIGAFEYVPPTPPPTPTPPGVLRSLALTPKTFRTPKVGGAILSKVKKAKKAPVGTTVSYALSAEATVSFTVERATKGRRAGKKCVKKTAQNKAKKACTLYKPDRRAAFSHTGKTGANSFLYSGHFRNKVLTPRTRPLAAGNYRLVGSAGGVTQIAPFKIVR